LIDDCRVVIDNSIWQSSIENLAMFKRCIAIALGVLLLSSPALAQLQQGTIVGRIVGPNGATIDQADITLFDQRGNAVTSVTASNGEFRISNVAPGSYSLRANAPPVSGDCAVADG